MKCNVLLLFYFMIAKFVSGNFFSFLFTYAECKLSRSGPPATIVTIDEESPNGMYSAKWFPTISVFHYGKHFFAQVAWATLLGLFQACSIALAMQYSWKLGLFSIVR